MSKFGLEIRDEMTLSVSRKRFDATVKSANPEITRPREGDLISLPVAIDHRRRVFEINYVKDVETYYQIGNLYTYEIRCRTFEYSGESFNTGKASVDVYDNYDTNLGQLLTSDGVDLFSDPDIVNNTEKYILNEVVIELISNTGTFVIGEQVYQSMSDFTGKVSRIIGNEIYIIECTGSLDNDDGILGTTSGAFGLIDQKQIKTEPKVTDTDTIRDEDGFINFNARNPFSE
jgi:hypothetical protein